MNQNDNFDFDDNYSTPWKAKKTSVPQQKKEPPQVQKKQYSEEQREFTPKREEMPVSEMPMISLGNVQAEIKHKPVQENVYDDISQKMSQIFDDMNNLEQSRNESNVSQTKMNPQDVIKYPSRENQAVASVPVSDPEPIPVRTEQYIVPTVQPTMPIYQEPIANQQIQTQGVMATEQIIPSAPIPEITSGMAYATASTIPPQYLQKQADKITVVYADSDQMAYSNHVAKIAQIHPEIEILGYAYNGKMAVEFVKAYKPDVLVIAHDTIIKDGITVAKEVMAEFPEMGVVVITTPDINFQVYVQSQGISNTLVRPSKTQLFSLEEFAKTVKKAKESYILKQKKQAELENQTTALQNQLLNKPKQPLINTNPLAATPSNKQVIVVYSPKGGSGKTMFSTNLACVLQKYTNYYRSSDKADAKVALWEMDMGHGAVDLFLNIKNRKTIVNMIQCYNAETKQFVSQTGEDVFEANMYTDKETDLKVLCGPTVPIESDYIEEEHVEAVMNGLKERFDTIIVDISSDIAKLQLLKVLDMADKVYIVMPMDVISIRNVKEDITLFKSPYFEFPEDKIKVVLNMVSDAGEFDVSQVYKVLKEVGVTPWGNIPLDRTAVVSSINKGRPLVLEDIDNKVSRAIYEIAMNINPEIPAEFINQTEKGNKKKSKNKGKTSSGDASESKSKGWFSSLFKKKNHSEPKPEKKESSSKKPFWSRKKEEPQEMMASPNTLSEQTNEVVPVRPAPTRALARLPKKR